jgi:hypothetical protein
MPHVANGVHEPSPRGVVLTERESPGLQEGEGSGRLGPAGGGEQNSEAAVGVAHQVRTVAHELGDVLGVTQEVLALRCGAASVAATVRH